ncbi:SDR family NAD(P)-dependent oxidoreductase [Salegentibacter sp. F188]|uniref:SDR family NAD(P)-dependent oxidoreductase n=1 Tax=Autumnicola patrickiae TaxID=3075591 RepID=A0ABU3E676_9FLAO|nr:SDR family NAD(P)-dependent oxidoreductase [Salegentibacter sp. F188]MDT0691455.1 SDR family NAD(P)-dependent oxidoreductase [Salegentibacter sp. F188]
MQAKETTSTSKVALVTGANQGMGFEIAKALAEHGYIVYVAARNIKKGEIAAAEIGHGARAIQLDITDKESINDVKGKIGKDFGYLTLLVNNAAISHAGNVNRTLEEMRAAQRASVASIDELRTVWETNVFGTLAITQALLPLLHNAPAARIVSLSSGLGSLTLNSDPNYPFRQAFDVIYAPSKTALNAVMLSLAIELENTNIKVNLVSPGFASTELTNFQGTHTPKEAAEEPIRIALEEDGPSGAFTTATNITVPW